MPSRFIARATIWNGDKVYRSGEEVPPEEFDGRTFSMLISAGQVVEEYDYDAREAPKRGRGRVATEGSA